MDTTDQAFFMQQQQQQLLMQQQDVRGKKHKTHDSPQNKSIFPYLSP